MKRDLYNLKLIYIDIYKKMPVSEKCLEIVGEVGEILENCRSCR